MMIENWMMKSNATTTTTFLWCLNVFQPTSINLSYNFLIKINKRLSQRDSKTGSINIDNVSQNTLKKWWNMRNNNEMIFMIISPIVISHFFFLSFEEWRYMWNMKKVKNRNDTLDEGKYEKWHKFLVLMFKNVYFMDVFLSFL